jgi:hypothetical protein
VERLQLKLQTLQATVQNLILSCRSATKEEGSLRNNVRNEINQNLNSSALQTNYSEMGRASVVEQAEEELATCNDYYLFN